MKNSMRISADNITVHDFDKLIENLKQTETKTNELGRLTTDFGGRLTDVRTELQNISLDTGAFNDMLKLVGQEFIQTSVYMEDYRNELIALERSAANVKPTSLRDIIQLPNASPEETEQTTVPLRNVGNEAELANPSITTFADVGQEAFGAIQSEQDTVGLEGWHIGWTEDWMNGWVESIRNLRLELVDLNATLSDTEDGLRNMAGATKLEGTTQRQLGALDNVTQVNRDGIETQLPIERATLVQLSHQERIESEHTSKLHSLAAQLREVEIGYEQEKTRFTREEVEKRTELNEHATQLRIAFTISEAATQLKTHQEMFDEISSLQSGTEILHEIRHSLQTHHLDAFAEEVRGIDVISRVKDGQAVRELHTPKLFTTGAENFRLEQEIDNAHALAFFDSLSPDVQSAIDSYREQRAIELDTDMTAPLSQLPTLSDRFAVGAGDLIAAVPLDVVDAVTDTVQVRRDANAEIVRLEQEAAAEIQIIQESVTLNAENKAKAIERIERETALERIRIENEVSQRQRASYQSVVTNFLSGTAKMIAAEAQLALSRRATDALSGLFGGGATGGASLFSSVLLPIVGGLSLAYSAAKLIAPNPSVEVYQKSQYGSVGTSGEQTYQGQQRQGLTRASQETDTPVLEANINVNVEASGTRLGQANERVKLKTERWGG